MFNFGNFQNYSDYDYIKPKSFGWKYTDEHKGENHPCYTVGKTSNNEVVLNLHASDGNIFGSLKMGEEETKKLINLLKANLSS